tara:strand:- start:1415 stop:1660 length:246 start_codon:yes stop_codon:yes gene_type:complete
MLDLLNTLTGYYFIGIIVSIIALYLLLYVDWVKVKSYISGLVILFIALLILDGQYFFALITIALIIIFWKKIPKSFFWWEN